MRHHLIEHFYDTARKWPSKKDHKCFQVLSFELCDCHLKKREKTDDRLTGHLMFSAAVTGKQSSLSTSHSMSTLKAFTSFVELTVGFDRLGVYNFFLPLFDLAVMQ